MRNNFVRKCSCDLKTCKYCVNHKRYLSELDLRKRRSSVRNFLLRERKAELSVVLGDFVGGRIGLRELEEVLNNG